MADPRVDIAFANPKERTANIGSWMWYSSMEVPNFGKCCGKCRLHKRLEGTSLEAESILSSNHWIPTKTLDAGLAQTDETNF